MLKHLLCKKVMEKGVADIIINMKKDMDERCGESSFDDLSYRLPLLLNTIYKEIEFDLTKEIILYLKENHSVKSKDKITFEISEMRNIKHNPNFNSSFMVNRLYDFDFFILFNVKDKQIKITFDTAMQTIEGSGEFVDTEAVWRVRIDDLWEETYNSYKAAEARKSNKMRRALILAGGYESREGQMARWDREYEETTAHREKCKKQMEEYKRIYF